MKAVMKLIFATYDMQTHVYDVMKQMRLHNNRMNVCSRSRHHVIRDCEIAHPDEQEDGGFEETCLGPGKMSPDPEKITIPPHEEIF
jgi:hypothetical protein